ncbi:MAG: peptidyl-prolyl cis-trans isomerase, partial [Flavobacteriales bacterium]
EAIQRQWKNFEQAIRDERIADKYKNLIKNGMYVTEVEAKRGYDDNGRLANTRLIRIDVNTIADSAVKVEESDLQAYYAANQYRYKQPETVRKVEYVTFDVNPSAQDQQSIMTWIGERKNELSTATDPVAVVNRNSDGPYDSTYHAKGTLPAALDTTLFTATAGTVVGPYLDGTSLKVARLMGEKMVSDSVKASHILLSIENGDTA